MAGDPVDKVLIRSIAHKEILRQIIIKLARESANPKGWVLDLQNSIDTARDIALLAAPPSQEHQALAANVSTEVQRLFNEIDVNTL